MQAGEQGVFVVEARVERADRRLGSTNDLGNGGAVKAALGNELFSRVENTLERFLAAGLMRWLDPFHVIERLRHYKTPQATPNKPERSFY